MRNAMAIFLRELRGFFGGPVAYVAAAMFLLVNGFIFYLQIAEYHLQSQTMQQQAFMMGGPAQINVTEHIIEPLFFTMAFIALLLLPMVSMRSFAEEKRQGTIELLFSYPVRDWEVVLGKYLSCVGVYLFMLLPTTIYVWIVAGLAPPEMGSVITGYVAVVLTGMAFLATGVLVSTLTANQIIAAVVTYSVLLLFWVLGVVEDFVPTGVGVVVTHLSLFTHVENLAKGVVDSRDIVFYALWIVVFLFFAALSVETQRWRGKAA